MTNPNFRCRIMARIILGRMKTEFKKNFLKFCVHPAAHTL